jgi:C1A family cysteine protease
MDQAFEYAAANQMELEATYPYQAVDGTCAYSQAQTKTKIANHVDVAINNAAQLQIAVVQQPISIAIDAGLLNFYSGGVIKKAVCGTSLDHGVLLVGYGTDAKLGDYWLVKNSWGASWGEAGYFRLQRDNGTDAGTCGLQSVPSYPTM